MSGPVPSGHTSLHNKETMRLDYDSMRTKLQANTSEESGEGDKSEERERARLGSDGGEENEVSWKDPGSASVGSRSPPSVSGLERERSA